MKKVLLGLSVMAGAIVVSTASTSASVTNNTSSNIVTVNTCAEMGRILNNASSNVVTLSNLGQCNVSEIVNSITAGSTTGNTSSNIIRIVNGCGVTSTSNVSNNTSSNIIQIATSGPCKPDQPTTVTITPAASTATTTPATVTTKPAATTQAAPTKLPVTGTGSVVGISAGIVGLLAYAGSYFRFLVKP